MEHVVFYPSAEGKPAFARVPSLEEATNFVEHLRNSDGITDFSVHALTAVPLAFRAYYHVEVPATGDETAAPAAATDEETATDEASAPADEAPEDDAPVAEALAAEASADESPVAEAPDGDAAEVDAPEVEAPEAEVAAAEPEAVEKLEEPVTDDASDVTMAPVEASDDDRSEEWVAEAVHVELPDVEAAPEVEVPVVAEPVAEAVGSTSLQTTPFAEAPPVTPPKGEVVAPTPVPEQAEAEVDAAVEAEIAPHPATAEVVPVPSGRRSMGFFAR